MKKNYNSHNLSKNDFNDNSFTQVNYNSEKKKKYICLKKNKNFFFLLKRMKIYLKYLNKPLMIKSIILKMKTMNLKNLNN
jgi:hypothetical protein